MAEKDIYSYKDFHTLKCGKRFKVGIFAPEIYGLYVYQFGTSSSNGYMEFYKISKDDFDNFPENEEELNERLFSNFFINRRYFLCTDYTDSCARFTRERYDNIKI